MSPASLRRLRPLLGTFVEVQVEAALCEDELQAAVDAAFARMSEIQERMSFHDPHSELSRINRAQASVIHEIGADTWRVLALARDIARRSDGLFDCTIGGELVREGRLPDHGFAPFDPPDWRAVELLPGHRVRLRRSLALTLDGIAKGYAVDQAVATLRALGVDNGLINAGGDLRVFGEQALPIAVREADGSVREIGRWRDCAIASSATGLPEDEQSRFPSCIMRPGAARHPESAGPPSVWTVSAAQAWQADALTKVAALAPHTRRASLIARLGGTLPGAPAS
ncbi:MAG: FAD:protein FMN transferase [Halothiobacillaceae bacterium]|nr:FAD:protein FMN transferase [Halothiobacillaceae bacterium]